MKHKNKIAEVHAGASGAITVEGRTSGRTHGEGRRRPGPRLLCSQAHSSPPAAFNVLSLSLEVAQAYSYKSSALFSRFASSPSRHLSRWPALRIVCVELCLSPGQPHYHFNPTPVALLACSTTPRQQQPASACCRTPPPFTLVSLAVYISFSRSHLEREASGWRQEGSSTDD
jgi:hypothetical protein